MSRSIEKIFAIRNAKHFLYDLIDPKKTPKVPKKIREEARRLLKHYPYDSFIRDMIEKYENL